MKLFRRKSTRDLLGVHEISDSRVVTAHGERGFLFLSPTNTSVLSREAMVERIEALAGVFKSLDSLELICLDASESFTGNQVFLRRRLEEETVPQIRDLLARDAAHLEEIRLGTISSRRFLLSIPLDGLSHREALACLDRTEQLLQERGFRPRRPDREELKGLMALYFARDLSQELPDLDGGLAGEKDFLDLIAPAAVRFAPDHFLFGGTCRSVWALRSYPASTQTQALLSHLGERPGVTIHIYLRHVAGQEEGKLLSNAVNRSRLVQSSVSDPRKLAAAAGSLQDVDQVAASLTRDRESLVHCAVYLELAAEDLDGLRQLQAEVRAELSRCRLDVDRLVLCQQRGFQTVQPWGRNVFASQFERVLPLSSAANLYPLHYSGRTDPHGFYLGRDRFGSNVIVDLDRRTEDRTNGHALVLGNSGQGKSFLIKLLVCNILESGKTVVCLDAENEYADLAESLNGCFMDMGGGATIINPLEPKSWEGGVSRLSRHISFLRDWFAAYKDFPTEQLDVIELMVARLYARWGLTDDRDLDGLTPRDFPILADLYALMEETLRDYSGEAEPLYTAGQLQDALLGLHSLCVGAESRFFNGHTNVTSARFLVFGVHSIQQASKNVRDAAMFNILSYMSHQLLHQGNAAAVLDELHVFLSDLAAISYIRDMVKRARKAGSIVIMGSQNLDDFNMEGVRDLTRPLFAIPAYQFLFNAGSVDKHFYMDHLQLTDSEYERVRSARKTNCLFKCGGERFLLEVHAPEYKAGLFGSGGGT